MGNVSEQNVEWFVRYRPGRMDEPTDNYAQTRRPDSTILFVDDNNICLKKLKIPLHTGEIVENGY